ncbi:MAG TPA: aminotransferase class V-fold PLP-dependent enzyme [Usitatibacter sp.]|jgi:alanine-glyoxylate transaminase/serine-glyoxylate transaminase/serine-pyruvate transaminase|nr:aminotransferase class V-fold PLP-dependent enzyme [Usitatibacter sp.]
MKLDEPLQIHIPGERLLHAPGPTHIPAEVLNAMHRQPMDHADPRLDAIIANIEAGLRRVLKTAAAELFLYAANGHGVWEAVTENLLAPGEAALLPATGHFSEQWAQQLEATGRRAIRTAYRPGYPIDPADVEAALRADGKREIAAVFVVHTDTASGITHDVAAIRSAIDAAGHPALLVVDVVASLAACPFAMDALGVNVAVGASQKGLMSPPGLGFVAVDGRGAAAAARNKAPRYYWDWARRRGAYSYTKFCGTPPQNLLYGVEKAFELVEREGLEAVIARHALLAAAVQAAVEGWSSEGAVKLHCRVPAARSASVTTIEVRDGVDVEELRSTARERFQVAFAGGLGPFGGKAFRIGHLGDLNAAMILGCLAGVEAAMLARGIAFGRDGVSRAVDVLAGRAA